MTAFGPAGTADGDDPQKRRAPLSGNPATPWSSDWYATADFGHLQAGTGLLLDMGRTVTITSVRLSLGGRPGRRRSGTGRRHARYWPICTRWRPPPARAASSQLSLASPVHARYLLIWFTKLPPDNTGTYQASVYDITVQRPALKIDVPHNRGTLAA